MSKSPPLTEISKPRPALLRLLWFFLAIWGVKVWLSIVAEYRWYFPPNFVEAQFLLGREASFVGLYSVAFYVHILASPVAIALTTLLIVVSRAMSKGGKEWLSGMITALVGQPGGIREFWKWHKRVGKFAAMLVVVMVVPSGLVMSWGTHFGPVAALGFTAHSLATLLVALLTIHFARARRIETHQIWSTVCWLLLCGPLVFRITSGFAYVVGQESEWVYQVNAWTSWTLLPLIWWSCRGR